MKQINEMSESILKLFFAAIVETGRVFMTGPKLSITLTFQMVFELEFLSLEN